MGSITAVSTLLVLFYTRISAENCSSNQCLIQSGVCSDSICNRGECLQINATHFQCFCRHGNSGVFCDKTIDECALGGLCKNNASCTNTQYAGFQCLCTPLFTGIYCDEPVDFCENKPCLNGATCLKSSETAFRCNCTAGFTGPHCETDVDECATQPCENGGRCHNTVGGYECECNPLFNGSHCEQSFCSSQTTNPCQNGVCLLDADTANGFRCKCSAGFTGRNCDENIDECIGVTCSGRGICVDDVATYRCLCLPGWTGLNCESRLDECSENQCQNSAACIVRQNGGYDCECSTGFQGRYCEKVTDHCRNTPCENGHCINSIEDYSCSCASGWTGRNCTIIDCSENMCLNGGICNVTTSGPQCNCSVGWSGIHCETPDNPCQLAPCQNGGICRPLSSTRSEQVECFCQPDFGGYYCEHRIDDCLNGGNCLNGGTCHDEVASFTCSCSSMFMGARCETIRPFPILSSLPTTTISVLPSAETAFSTAPSTSTQISNASTFIPVIIFSSATPASALQTATTSRSLWATQNNAGSYATASLLSSDLNLATATPTAGNVTVSGPIVQQTETLYQPENLIVSNISQATTVPTITSLYNVTKFETSANNFISAEPLLNGRNASVEQKPACIASLCRNGGSCRSQDDLLMCDCPFPYSGDECENEMYITRPLFNGKAWLQYASVKLESDEYLEVSIRLLPNSLQQENATIFYATSETSPTLSTHLMILNSTTLLHNVSCGVDNTLTMIINKPANSADFTTISFRQRFPTMENPTCSIWISTGSSTRASAFSLHEVNRSVVTLDNIFLGGFPASLSNYSGVISNLEINGKEMDFHTAPVAGVNVQEADKGFCSEPRCKNGGICLESSTGWTCLCSSQYTGSFCEVATCNSNPCVGGSTCVMKDQGDPVCVCPVGRHGPLCESTFSTDSNIRLFGPGNYSSFISYAPIRNGQNHLEIILNLTLPQNTSSLNDSLLMLIGRPELVGLGYDYLIVALQGNLPVMVYNLGGGPLAALSPLRMDRSQRNHSIHVFLNGSVGAFLTINDAPVQTSPFPLDYHFNSFEGLYQVNIGGFDTIDNLPLFWSHAFDGTIREASFRTRSNVAFTRFSKLVSGRNVLPDEFADFYNCSNQSCSGTCESIGASFRCLCNDGASENQNCTSLDSVCKFSRHQCRPQSKCVPDFSAKGYRCDCALGMSGQFCEQDITISDALFNGFNSYLTFSPTQAFKDTFSIKMQIKAQAPSGLLFYAAEYPNSRTLDFLALFLYSGSVYFRFNCGNGITKSISSKILVPVDNITWSTIVAGRNQTNAWLTVNDSTIMADVLVSGNKFLSIHTPLFVGGVDSWQSLASSTIFGDLLSFHGCIRQFSVNGLEYELNERGAEDGMNVDDCDGTRCGYDVCQNGGACTPGKASFSCSCPQDFSGLGCQIPSQCETSGCLGECQRTKNFTTCDCQLGTSGKLCNIETDQELTAMQFTPDSYLTIQRPKTGNLTSVFSFLSFWFRTNASDALFVWTGKAFNPYYNYLGIGLRGGVLHLAWNSDWSARKSLFPVSNHPLHNGKWHQLELERSGGRMRINILNEENQLVVSLNNTTMGNLATDGMYHFGNFPRQLKLSDTTSGYFSQPFEGCIANITFDLSHESVIRVNRLMDGRNLQLCRFNEQ